MQIWKFYTKKKSETKAVFYLALSTVQSYVYRQIFAQKIFIKRNIKQLVVVQ